MNIASNSNSIGCSRFLYVALSVEEQLYTYSKNSLIETNTENISIQ